MAKSTTKTEKVNTKSKTNEEILNETDYVLSAVELIKKAKKPNKKSIEAMIDIIGAIQTLEKELSDKKESLKDIVKVYMKGKDLSEVMSDIYMAKYSEYESESFDTTRFKKEKPKMYSQYLKVTCKTRFTVDNKKATVK